ncbi:MAG: virulence factor SrfC family protein [Hyphomicrobiaceae bacterium]
MNPKQQLEIVLRQTLEANTRLQTWLDQEGHHLGWTAAGLKLRLAHVAGGLEQLQGALDRPTTVGVLPLSHRGIASLVSGLIAHGRDDADGSHHRSLVGLCRAVLGGGDCGPPAISIRLVAAPRHPPPDGFPIAVKLLSLSDLVAVVVKSYFRLVPDAMDHAPSKARLAAICDEADGKLSGTAVPGLSRRDVEVLRARLSQLFPDAGGLRDLEAQGFWERAGDAASYLPVPERTRLFSVLWNEEPAFTALFQRLSEAHARIGAAGEIYCPRDALFRTGAGSGWPACHPQSITLVTTLGAGTGSSDEVRIAARYGQRTSLGRMDLAALAAEVHLGSGEMPLPALPGTELVAFPPVASLPLAARWRGTVGSRDGSLLWHTFAQEKAAYLFERACNQLDVNGLIVTLDGDSDAVDRAAPAINDWVRTTHGATAAARECVPNALVVVACLQNSDHATDDDGAGARSDARLRTMLADGVGGGPDWLEGWTPGEPFRQFCRFRYDDGDGEGTGRAPGAWNGSLGPNVETMRPRGLNALPRRQGHSFTSPRDGALRALAGDDVGVGAILTALRPGSRASNRQRQLKSQLVHLRRRQRGSLLRFGLSGDGEDAVTWRREIATLLHNRVARRARDGRLGVLLSALAITEAELEAIAWRLLRGASVRAHDWSGVAVGQGAMGDGVLELEDQTTSAIGLPEAFSETVLAHWFATMGQVATSERFAAEAGLTTDTLLHLLDEIVQGARRVGLERHLANELARDQQDRAVRHMQAQFVVISQACINGFLERLQIPAAAMTGTQAHPRRSGIHSFSDGWGDGFAASMPRVAPLALRWTASLAAMMEANIADASRATFAITEPTLAQAIVLAPVDYTETNL